MTANVFDNMGIYWAEIADNNQTEKQIQFLESHLRPNILVLDVACGTGRHLIPLSQQGYDMVGLDVSSNLLRIAKQRDKQAQVIKGDMRCLPFNAQVFTAAISMDNSFGYLPTERDDSQSLIEIRRALKQDGELIIDVFNRKNLSAKYVGKKQNSKWREYPSFFFLQKRKMSPNGDNLCDLWTISDKTKGQIWVFKHTSRLYRFNELKALIEKASFKVNEVYGDYEGKKFTINSTRLILMAATT
jgi:ubiquinone/menaquinone biosynthesis C-methylase UbiE